MTDAELIALLQEKSPRDLSPAEVAALRERWPQSAEVRQALLACLQLETELSAALGGASLSVDELLARASLRAADRSRGRAWRAWLLSGLAGLLLLVGYWLWQRPGPPSPAAPVAVSPVAEVQPAAPKEAATAGTDAMPPTTDPAATAHGTAAPGTTDPGITTVGSTTPGTTTPATGTAPTTSAASTRGPAEPQFPWSAWLAPTARPLAVGSPQMLGDLRSLGHDEFTVDEFRRWWADLPGQSSHASQSLVNGKRTVQFQGTVRLQAPWLSDTCLRLTPFDVEELALTFWTGEQGVQLQFYRHREPHLWAAFAVERKADGAASVPAGLLTTDSGAVYRSGVATLEFQHRNGALVLAIAQTPVLEVPVSQPPREVWLHGRFRLRGASWVRSEQLPEWVPPESAVVWSSRTEGAPAWDVSPAEAASLQRGANGTLSFRAEPARDAVSALLRLPEPGLYEVVFQFGGGDPGTGVVLGDAAGKPLARLGLLRERRSGQLTLAGLRPQEHRRDSDYDPRSFPPPYLAAGQWVRLIAGWGTLQIAVSGDGLHWGHVVESPLREVRGAVQSVGLYALPENSPRHIELRHLEVRRLSGLASLVDPHLLRQAAVDPADMPRDLPRWQQRFLEVKPVNVPAADWWNACALATLQAGPPPELVTPLLDRLLVEPPRQTRPPQHVWQCYGDALKLVDHWPERDAAVWTARFAESIRGRDHRQAAVEAAWTNWLQAPFWTHGSPRDAMYRALADALLERAEAGDGAGVERLSRLALHLVAPAHPDHQPRDFGKALEQLARWSRGYAAESAAALRDQTDEVFPQGWRHPFQPLLDKDAYNAHAELRAALDSAAYRDAARMTMSLGQGDLAGLVPDGRDPDLFLALPAALAEAWRNTPAYAQALHDEISETGWLRVRQALARSDAAAMQSLTLQFFGTTAAAEAHRWLGDRWLALGDFPTAWRCYERAWPFASAEQRNVLLPRKTLARSLMGLLPGEAEMEPRPQEAEPAPSAAAAQVVIAGQDLSSAIQELRGTAPALASDHLAALPSPVPPRLYRLEPRARFDGQAGHHAGQGEFRDTDAFGRQFAVTVDSRHVYVSNRFQVTAYDRAQGQAKWAVAVGSEQGSAHAHRFTPMPALVVDHAVFVRRITKAGIELACLDASNGTVRWHGRPGDRGQWLSDPVWTRAGLRALAAHRGDDETLDLRWTLLHPETGQLLAETPLFRLRDAWQMEVPCRVAVQGWNVVACVGGTVACFGLDGEVQWVRRCLWLPPKLDPLNDDYWLTAPILSERDVLVSQPGSRAVECLDLATGRRRWRYVAADVQGLLGATRQRVLIGCARSLIACDRATGKLLWQRPIEQRLTALAASDEVVLASRVLPHRGNRGWLNLLWLDAATGAELAQMPVDSEPREDWRFGPCFAVDQQVWSFAGQSWRDPHRDLVLLAPVPQSSAGPWQDDALAAWQPTLEAHERRAAQIVLPGWLPLAATPEVLSLASGEVRGRAPVLVSRLKNNDVLHFMRHVALQDNKSTTLLLRVGHQPGQRWRLQVRVDARLVVDRTVEEATSSDGWVEHSVSLGPSTSRTVLVEVSQRCLDNQSAEGLWHGLAIEMH